VLYFCKNITVKISNKERKQMNIQFRITGLLLIAFSCQHLMGMPPSKLNKITETQCGSDPGEGLKVFFSKQDQNPRPMFISTNPGACLPVVEDKIKNKGETTLQDIRRIGKLSALYNILYDGSRNKNDLLFLRYLLALRGQLDFNSLFLYNKLMVFGEGQTLLCPSGTALGKTFNDHLKEARLNASSGGRPYSQAENNWMKRAGIVENIPIEYFFTLREINLMKWDIKPLLVAFSLKKIVLIYRLKMSVKRLQNILRRRKTILL
jgi:hypothetical protein